MNFDKYFTISTCNKRRSSASSSACGRSSIPGKEILLSPTMPTRTHIRNRWNPKTRNWSVWTLRDPLLADICGPVKLPVTTQQKLRLPLSKPEFLEILYKSTYRLCAEFERIPSSAIVVKTALHDIYTSNQICYGESFIYSPVSDTITIDTRELSFEEGGKKENKTASEVIKLYACSGLAQILAACIKKDDLFVIVGSSIALNQTDLQVPLNVLFSENEESSHLTLIRLTFDILDPKVRMIEKIEPFSSTASFTFKYVCRDMDSGFSREVVRHRHFSLENGMDSADDQFEMPVTRGADLADVYGKLLQEQFSWNRHVSFEAQQRQRLTSTESSGYSSSSPDSVRLTSHNLMEPSQRRLRNSALLRYHRYSTDDEDQILGSHPKITNFGRGNESLSLTILKIFLCIICPVIVLGVCAMLFNPVTPTCCTCTNGEIPPISPIMADFSPNYAENYEDPHAHPYDYDF